jgi:hypothetical protein
MRTLNTFHADELFSATVISRRKHNGSILLLCPLGAPGRKTETSDIAAITEALNGSVLRFTLGSPADLRVISPDGSEISKRVRGIWGASYQEHIKADGDVGDTVEIPHPQSGQYSIYVVREPGVVDTATFSLSATLNGQTVLLADHLAIGAAEQHQFALEAHPDADDDGVGDADDNCSTTANPSQTDLNQNRLGDACESGRNRIVADAGDDTVLEAESARGANTLLDGSGSTGPENSSLNFLWRSVFGTVSGQTVSVLLPIGTHSFELTVSDQFGRVDTDSVTVSVRDSRAPTVIVAGALIVASSGPGGVAAADAALEAFLHGATASDLVNPLPVRRTPQIGGIDVRDDTILPMGATTVTFRFRDFSGNIGTATATVTVIVDTTPPVITSVPSSQPNPAGWHNSQVSVTWFLADNESGIATSSGCATTTVASNTTGITLTCSATNGAGVSASRAVTLKIDQTAPSISSLTASPNLLWPPNHRMVPISIVASVFDAQDANPSCRILSVASNEP